jgi:hypothetical protein
MCTLSSTEIDRLFILYIYQLNNNEMERHMFHKSSEIQRRKSCDSNQNDVKTAHSLDSIIESPKIRLPKPHRWYEHHEKIGIQLNENDYLNNTLNEK